MVGTVALAAAPVSRSEGLWGSAEAALLKPRRYGNDVWSFILNGFN